MRVALTTSTVGAGAGSAFEVQQLRSTYYRDWWLRSMGGPVTYTLDVYGTQADAVAQANRLAFATHGVGTAVQVAFTVDPGAPFDCTPMGAQVLVAGTWTSRIVGWLADVESKLIERIVAILDRYRQPNEALADVANETIVGDFDGGVWPACGVTPAAGDVTARQTREHEVGVWIDLYFADMGADDPASVKNVLSKAGTLRSIACDEQRTWGGFAIHTEARGPIQAGTIETKEGFEYRAIVPIVVHVPDFNDEEDPTTFAVGSGGKYVVGL